MREKHATSDQYHHRLRAVKQMAMTAAIDFTTTFPARSSCIILQIFQSTRLRVLGVLFAIIAPPVLREGLALELDPCIADDLQDGVNAAQQFIPGGDLRWPVQFLQSMRKRVDLYGFKNRRM